MFLYRYDGDVDRYFRDNRSLKIIKTKKKSLTIFFFIIVKITSIKILEKKMETPKDLHILKLLISLLV